MKDLTETQKCDLDIASYRRAIQDQVNIINNAEVAIQIATDKLRKAIDARQKLMPKIEKSDANLNWAARTEDHHKFMK